MGGTVQWRHLHMPRYWIRQACTLELESQASSLPNFCHSSKLACAQRNHSQPPFLLPQFPPFLSFSESFSLEFQGSSRSSFFDVIYCAGLGQISLTLTRHFTRSLHQGIGKSSLLRPSYIYFSLPTSSHSLTRTDELGRFLRRNLPFLNPSKLTIILRQ